MFPIKNFESLLQLNVNKNFKIKDIDWKYLTNPGENFGSLLFAVNVTLQQNSEIQLLHVIVKLPPPSPYLIKLFNSPFTFKKEIEFYKNVTPTLLQFQRECGIIHPEDSWPGAKYYGSRMGLTNNNNFDEQASIVLENLNYSGYQMIDRLIGLNRIQTEFAIKKLAGLHAVVIALKIKKPQIFHDNVMPALKSAITETVMQCIQDMIQKGLKDMESINEIKPYIELVKKSIDMSAKIIETEKRDETWCTLVHNDFWINNMMFKFNENKQIIDMKIVDFQLGAYDYGVKDLVFFLLTSPENDIIQDIFDDMIHLYYQYFIDTLKTLNINTDNFKRDKLIDLVEYCAPLKLSQCIMMAQVVKSKPGTAPKMEDIHDKESFLKMTGDEAYYDKLRLIFNIYQKKNWFLANQN
ncbi:uncharacterized protein [Chelonus insularis]|uniref:uncharacterized protein n=1 Tax=Chelonus insularis TaxID=460826 RepID=UPI00158B53F6|nr:uncharacterized protein LOC118064508 [Chelonus insularis]